MRAALPPRVRALRFDMDGTLVDSMPAHARSWEAFGRRHALPLGIDEILRRTTGRNGVECIRELFGEAVDEPRALALIAQKEALYRELFDREFKPVAGVHALFARAADAGMPVAIATAGDRHNIAFTLERLRLPYAPHAVVGGDEGLRGKPDPDIFLAAAGRLGCAPHECLVFEDAPFGIEAARRAGMHAVAICTTHTPAALAGPHVLLAAPDFEAVLASGLFG